MSVRFSAVGFQPDKVVNHDPNFAETCGHRDDGRRRLTNLPGGGRASKMWSSFSTSAYISFQAARVAQIQLAPHASIHHPDGIDPSGAAWTAAAAIIILLLQ
jgi:hypothetical protein